MATANNKKWWKNSIIYQIYPRSFCDSNGDGIGDIQGIISKLSYLKDLGVDAIWLNPVYASPGYDNGYDISDYKSINPEYGSMEDMEKLISKSKRLGIKIIMDLVINHTSDQHEWFKKALENDPKYRNYYIFKSNKGLGAPNNWGSFFGGKAWSKTSDGSYYLHLFSPNQPDLNWDNPDVYNEFIDIMKFWLDKGIAGFRCDVINCIYKCSLDNGKKRIALSGIEHYLNSDGCHEILKKFNEELWSKYKTFSIGETVFINPDEARLFCDEERNELDAVFSFEHMEVDCLKIKWLKKKYRPNRLIKTIDKWQSALAMPANYFENHDQIRSINHFGNVTKYWEESAKMLCGLNLSLKGIPFIYEGQEIGMMNGDFNSISELRDIESKNINRILKKLLFFAPHIRRKIILQTTRDNARTPMQWDNSLNGGFTTGIPWIKVNSNKDIINVKKESESEDSVLSFYRAMIEFRKNSKALSEGDYRRVASAKDVYIFTRESFEERLYIYCNLSDNNKAVEYYGDYIVFDNYKEFDREDNYLKPYEFRIIKSNI